jgi:hypothetical protein
MFHLAIGSCPMTWCSLSGVMAGMGWVGQAIAADSLTIGASLKGHVGENVGFGLVHQGVKLWNLGPQLVGDLAPLGFGGLGVVPRAKAVAMKAEMTRRPFLAGITALPFHPSRIEPLRAAFTTAC